MTTIAQTAQGRVEGRLKNDVLLFAGVPYAAPPVGPLRFRAPQRHAPWSDTRPAKRFGPASPQNPGTGMTGVANTGWDEDCLTLNISTPAIDDARRPVLVWIHGGGYRTGQGAIPWYDGANFARNGDLVVVSINYRLGALGFAHLARFGDELASSGANGTSDQIFALEWVRDNIANFGGDPDNVTIAGESAGGFSVGTLLGSPRAAGLFKRAIPQSGAAHHTLPISASEKVTDLLCDLLSIRTTEDLMSVSVPEILDAQAKIYAELDGGALGAAMAPLYPTVDGHVIAQDPLDAIRSGLSANVPVLIGTNTDETTLFGHGELDGSKLSRMVTGLGGDDALLRVYRESRPQASDGELAVAVTSDHMFRIPAVRLAEARFDQSAPTYMYLFDWKSRAFGGKLGATHALEIPFAFDNLDRAGVGAFLGEGPRPQHVADAMHAAWIGFIRNGDPNHPGIPKWSPYDDAGRDTMVFADETRASSDPFGAERRTWHGIR